MTKNNSTAISDKIGP